MATDIEKEKKYRAAARGWLTRAANALDKILSEKDIDDTDLDDAVSEFDKRLSALDETQAAVESVITLDELDKDIDEAVIIRDQAKKSRKNASRYLEKIKSSLVDDDSASVSSAHSLKTVKLPRLELPKFSGNVIQWQTFWDKFKAIVDMSDLPDISKFTYLQSLLEGEAKSAIEGLSLTSTHYAIACKLLEERFGRREHIIFAHIQGLLTMNTIPQGKGSRTSTLRKLQDELLSHVRSLEALDINGKDYGIFLTPVILSRLPNDIRMEWSREGEGKESDIEWLLSFLKKEIERRERSEAFKESNKHTDQSSEEKRGPKHASASALQASSQVGKACGFCHKNHKTDKCWGVLNLSIPERQEKMKEAGLCFRCLGTGHIARGCAAKCSQCQGRHHKLCCFANKPNEAEQQTMPKTVDGSNDNTSAANLSYVGVAATKGKDNRCTILPTAKVYVSGERGSIEATLLFDSGSDRSYVTNSLVRKVRPKWLSSLNVTYAAFGGGKSNNDARNVYQLRTKGVHGGSKSFELLSAVEVPVICAPLQRPKVSQGSLEPLRSLPLADEYSEGRNMAIDILVGLDHYWDLMKSGFFRLPGGPVAQETVYGWVVSGSCPSDPNRQTASVSNQLLCLSDVPDVTLRNFWNLEVIGISPDKDQDTDFVDPVLSRFNDTVKFSGGRYEVALPWKEKQGPVQLLDNEKLARNRLASLSGKLAKDLELRARYDEVLSEMEANDVIREVPPEGKSTSHRVYYLPHHPVVKESSVSTKVRPVFDASAAGFNGVSLNDCLETGPSLIPSLVEILIRFRRWKVALTADITKAFLQIRVREEDQDVHRFLWDHNGSVRIMKILRVPFGNKSSPFLLNATIRHHLSKYPEGRVVEELKENLYVDDWLTGANSEEECCELFQGANEMMLEANMPLAKCASNNDVVSDMFFQEFGAKHVGSESVKILGLKWLTGPDCFSFDGLEVPVELTTTKRVVLSFLARLFDPLGFLTPFTMVPKILIQEMWQLGLDWDADVPEGIHVQFLHWVSGLKLLHDWQIPRCYTSSPWTGLGGMELHSFGDASERGYGAVVYLRVPSGDGTFDVSIVTARARVAPLKKVTVPRLELLGALLAARLVVFVCGALKLPELTYRCWTDSTVALAWIKGDPGRWKPFVANRVTEIQGLTDPSCWAHCCGKDNPADLVTRGMLAEDLIASKIWLKGPVWLASSLDGEHDDVQYEQPGQIEEEVAPVVTVVTEPPVPDILEVERWGTFQKALHVVSWVLRFIRNLKSPASQRLTGSLSYEEVTNAKVKLFGSVQKATYPREIEMLNQGQLVQKNSSLYRLNPFVGRDGLLRIKGRLQRSELPYEEKHPIILPKCHLTKLLVRFQHELLKHAGVDTVISSLRNTYWIVGLRRLMKTVKRACVACQRIDAQACNQPAAPLPELRVQKAPPFTVSGVDYAGPLFCCDLPKKKLYILLFTCAVVRAVHLELTDSLTLKDFMLALRRFTARRGLPSIIYSDNAKTFIGAKDQLLQHFGPASPKWKFIVPRSPWWGGWWERLVRSVKGSLKKSLGVRCLTRSELETTLHEVEACINSRPLTFVGDEVDSINPLTPSHFLIGRNAGFQIEVSEDEEVVSQRALSDREIVRQGHLNQFWLMWSKDYLRNLPPTINRLQAKGAVQEGSLVLVREDNIPRMKWPLGLVTQVYPGKDGIVRTVQLRTAKGLIVRSIQRLHDLEINGPSQIAGGFFESETDTENASHKIVTRYGRVSRPVERY